MINIRDFYLENFCNEKINNPNIKHLDPELVSAFKIAKKRLNINDWMRIKEKFQEKLGFIFSLDEEMCFFILSCVLQEEFLDKGDNFITNICSFLCSIQLSPFSYVEVTKSFLKEPIYSLCADWQGEWPFYPFELYFELQSKTETSEGRDNLFLRMMESYYGRTFHILFDEQDDLYTIYLKIKKEMEKANEKMLYYVKSDFETLDILKQIIDNNDDNDTRNARIDLNMIEYSQNTISAIIKSTLLYLKAFEQSKRPKLALLRTQKKQV